MKTILSILSIAILCVACLQSKKLYRLPDEMLPHVKTEYDARCMKGQSLYQLNCSSCHTTKIKGKAYIPDFTSQQLQGYTLRVINQQHEQNMPDSLVSEEELVLICTFLSYKPKNPSNINVPVPQKK